MSTSSSCTIPARAALAGNPSDGHGGAVVATVVASLAATVTADRGSHFSFAGSPLRHSSAADVSEWVERGEFDGDQPLMQATVAVLHRRLDADPSPHRFRFSTTIPRSLGLAGSSAIVVATIISMVDAHHHERWARELVDQPALIASLALEAERDILGIPAGLQDRVVQTFGGIVAMEFGEEHMREMSGLDVGSYRPVGPLPDGMFIAYREGSSRDSGLVHGAVDVASLRFQLAMARAADAGRAAATAIQRGDAGALGAAMDESFDQRAAVYRLDPAHVEMVDVARSTGASANYTGSGGSVIVLPDDDSAAAALADLGCSIVHL